MFDWGLVDEAPQDARILLAGGLTAENVTTAIYRVNPGGGRLDGRGEGSRPQGPVKLKAFIEAARSAAPTPYRGPDQLPYDWADE